VLRMLREKKKKDEDPFGDEDKEEEEDKFDIDDLSGESSSQQDTAKSSPQQGAGSLDYDRHHHDHRRVNLVYKSSDTGVVSPDRFAGEQPHPPSVHPRHLISEAAAKIRHGSHPHVRPVVAPLSQLSPKLRSRHSLPRDPQRDGGDEGRDGNRDNIRAPESTFQSNKSQIPKDRDIEAESQLVVVGPSSTSDVHTSSQSKKKSGSGQQSHAVHSSSPSRRVRRKSRSASVRPPSGEMIRPRRGSFDGVTAARHAFAAWGLDETDSNASDSDR